MNYKAVTIGREYGSGGGEIARIVAEGLGWRLVDHLLLQEISRRAGVPETEAAEVDEHVDPWLHRVMRPLWGRSADGVSMVAPVELFDADAAASLAEKVIREAYRAGNCVIVGRAAQCVLRSIRDVRHVFVYAPFADRMHRIAARAPRGADVSAVLRAKDEERLEYVRRHYGLNRLDPHLYDLMINSHGETKEPARIILQVVRGCGGETRAAGA